MRVLTVRHPWAWSIIHGGKDVENRTRNIAGSYRGPVAIHSSATRFDLLSQMDPHRPGVREALRAIEAAGWPDLDFGAIIGVVDLVDVHHAAECVYVGPAVEDFDGTFVSQEVTHCSPWAEGYNVYHLALANPRPLRAPVPFRGALGLRRLDVDVTAAVLGAIA